MNWKAIIIYGTCLSVAQIVLGFLSGLFGASSLLSAWNLASLVICTALFTLLAARIRVRTFAHACLTLGFYGVISLVLTALVSAFLGNVPPLFIALEWLELIVSLAVGLSIGSAIRSKRATPREA